MNANYILQKVKNIQKGRYTKVCYLTEVPLSAAGKKSGVHVFKRVIGTYRFGIDYSNTKKGIAKQTASIDPKAGQLAWGKWMSGAEGYLIEHTNKNGEYNVYLRMYNSPNKARVQYYINNKAVSKEQLMATGYVNQSYFTKASNDSGCVTINIQNLDWVDKPIIG